MRDIGLRKAYLASLGTIDVDLDRGVGDLLVNMDVDRSRNGGDACEDALGDGIVLLGAAGNLNIDRRRQTEVEDLIGDVGRGKEEGASGEFGGEIVAQQAHVFGGVALAGIERDKDVSIGIGDGGAGDKT